jgi:hypothetical protein
MVLNAPIGLSGEDRQECSFTMPAKATNLNKHGAAIQLNRELLVGSTVVVRNKSGTKVSARVVAQLAALQGVPTYTIEFAEQDDRVKTFLGNHVPVRRKQRSYCAGCGAIWNRAPQAGHCISARLTRPRLDL